LIFLISKIRLFETHLKDTKKPGLIKNEAENQPNAPKGGMKKVRSYDVLKSDEIGSY